MKPYLLLLSLFIFSCGENVREEILERYDDGKKKIVEYYKDDGDNLIEEVKERYDDGKQKVVEYYKKVCDNQEMVRKRIKEWLEKESIIQTDR